MIDYCIAAIIQIQYSKLVEVLDMYVSGLEPVGPDEGAHDANVSGKLQAVIVIAMRIFLYIAMHITYYTLRASPARME